MLSSVIESLVVCMFLAENGMLASRIEILTRYHNDTVKKMGTNTMNNIAHLLVFGPIPLYCWLIIILQVYDQMYMIVVCMCVCVCVCVCVCACACMRACVCVCMWIM